MGITTPFRRIEVNYRANIWALKEVGVTDIIAVAAVGGIDAGMPPGSLVIPDQIIDYTWGRGHTFFEGDLDRVVHVDFTEPYTRELRHVLITAARKPRSRARYRGPTGWPRGRGWRARRRSTAWNAMAVTSWA